MKRLTLSSTACRAHSLPPVECLLGQLVPTCKYRGALAAGLPRLSTPGSLENM